MAVTGRGSPGRGAGRTRPISLRSAGARVWASDGLSTDGRWPSRVGVVRCRSRVRTDGTSMLSLSVTTGSRLSFRPRLSGGCGGPLGRPGRRFGFLTGGGAVAATV